jgi:serine kinase
MVDFKKWFIFMQLGENGDLLKFITEYGPLRERRARLLFTQLLSAVDYLHKKSIVHRDIKCENVLLTPAYNIKLSDFGFAKEVTKLPDKDEYAKSTTFCGSLQYAAPEIIRGVEHNPFMVDIWSCGILLYVILNQALPFEQTSRKSLYTAQMKKSWKWRKFVSAKASNNLKVFLPRLLQPQPHRRLTTDQLLRYAWITEEPPQSISAAPNSPESEPISMMTLKALPSTMEHKFIPATSELMHIAIPKEEVALLTKQLSVGSSSKDDDKV